MGNDQGAGLIKEDKVLVNSMVPCVWGRSRTMLPMTCYRPHLASFEGGCHRAWSVLCLGLNDAPPRKEAVPRLLRLWLVK